MKGKFFITDENNISFYWVQEENKLVVCGAEEPIRITSSIILDENTNRFIYILTELAKRRIVDSSPFKGFHDIERGFIEEYE
jgi:hypothetical protein